MSTRKVQDKAEAIPAGCWHSPQRQAVWDHDDVPQQEC
jgi:hypothetical protein